VTVVDAALSLPGEHPRAGDNNHEDADGQAYPGPSAASLAKRVDQRAEDVTNEVHDSFPLESAVQSEFRGCHLDRDTPTK
jgi:hypothetical protein